MTFVKPVTESHKRTLVVERSVLEEEINLLEKGKAITNLVRDFPPSCQMDQGFERLVWALLRLRGPPVNFMNLGLPPVAALGPVHVPR